MRCGAGTLDLFIHGAFTTTVFRKVILSTRLFASILLGHSLETDSRQSDGLQPQSATKVNRVWVEQHSNPPRSGQNECMIRSTIFTSAATLQPPPETESMNKTDSNMLATKAPSANGINNGRAKKEAFKCSCVDINRQWL